MSHSCIVDIHSLEELQKTLGPFFARDFHALPPFSPLQLEFCQALSLALLHPPDAALYPDFVALAFWLREKHLLQLREAFNARDAALSTLHIPRGVVFHIPPATIDVMLVYSWICSLLVGNGNILRLPSIETPGSQKLLNAIFTLLTEERFSLIHHTTFFVRYGHDDTLTSWISSHIDVRLIWGSDATVIKIRSLPLRAHAKDIAFPNRFSFAVIDADAYLQADQMGQQQLSQYFFNDIFLFDQSACSSPRLLFWIGTPLVITEASEIFYRTLQATIRERAYTISLGGVLLKQSYMYDSALSLPLEKVTRVSNELCIMYLYEADARCRKHCGQGLLYHVPIAHLSDITRFVTSSDQTLSYYGLSNEQLYTLARQLNGRGITRMVPFGQALNFEAIWDGVDLLAELTQCITLQ